MDVDTSLKTILKGAGFFFIGAIFSKAFSFVYAIVTARWLGPSDYGLLNIGIMFLGIGTILSTFGLNAGVMRFVSYYKSKGKEDYVKGVVLTSVKIVILTSILVSLFFYLISPYLAYVFFGEEGLLAIMPVFILAMPFNTLRQLFVFISRGFNNAKYPVYAEQFFMQPVRFFLTILFLLFGLGVVGVSTAVMFSVIMTSLLMLYFLEFRVHKIFRSKVKAKTDVKRLLSYSWPLAFTPMIYILLTWTDTLMIGYFLNAAAVGIYNVARPASVLIMVFPDSLNMLFVPVITSLYALRKKDEMRSVYLSVSKWIFIACLPLFLLFVVFPDNILTILFDSRYVSAAMPLSVLSLGYFLSVITGPGGGILSSLEKTKLLLFTSLVAACLNVVLNIVLIPVFGITGAALATSLSIISQYWMNMIIANKHMRIIPFGKHYVRPLFAGGLSILLIYTIKNTFPLSLLWVAFLFALFWSLYLMFLVLFRAFDEKDLKMINAVEKRTGIRMGFIRSVLKKIARRSHQW